MLSVIFIVHRLGGEDSELQNIMAGVKFQFIHLDKFIHVSRPNSSFLKNDDNTLRIE